MAVTINRSHTMKDRSSINRLMWTYGFWQPTIRNGLSLALWILVPVVTDVTCDSRNGASWSSQRKFGSAPVSEITCNLSMTEGMKPMLVMFFSFVSSTKICPWFHGLRKIIERDGYSRKFNWWFTGLSLLARSLGRVWVRRDREVKRWCWWTAAAVRLWCSELFRVVCFANTAICIELRVTCSCSKEVKLSELDITSF